MLASLGSTLLSKLSSQYSGAYKWYNISITSLSDQISMRPRDILSRSIQASNWATLIVILLCYPILLYFRGLDWHLLGGMVVMYASFWAIVCGMVLTIQIIYLVFYCISQRFEKNMLDFEILERLLGRDRSWDDDEYDELNLPLHEDSDEDDGDVDDENATPGRLRATG